MPMWPQYSRRGPKEDVRVRKPSDYVKRRFLKECSPEPAATNGKRCGNHSDGFPRKRRIREDRFRSLRMEQNAFSVSKISTAQRHTGSSSLRNLLPRPL